MYGMCGLKYLCVLDKNKHFNYFICFTQIRPTDGTNRLDAPDEYHKGNDEEHGAICMMNKQQQQSLYGKSMAGTQRQVCIVCEFDF
jgi:hypothetical protein